MKTEIEWTKGIFNNTYQIRGDGLSGHLKVNTFTFAATGELGEHHYSFKTKGFFKKRTHITHRKSNRIIGEVILNTWKSKAEVIVNGHSYFWRATNIWLTKWQIADSQKIYIKSQTNGFSTKGKMYIEELDFFLILTGLYIKDCYLRMNSIGA